RRHYRDVPDALSRVAASNSSEAAKLCLRFLVLTAACSTEAACVRGDLFEQRRELMAAWADYVTGKSVRVRRDGRLR
ncbi:MAG: hypothetical protein OXI97_01185, partial [Acidimicrobiaceae bacterium]|nr:hypothetical protein [Acidimicrobiaceae bacterium]